ncbi:MAG: primosomal protein N' [Microbacteriaceae bacterium]|nr:primosomal protein N' [Microbacteriaceae bacterium]
MSDSRRIARVVLDTRLPQLDRLFDYIVPEGMELTAGVRVKVPLRSQKNLAEGYVVAVVGESDHSGKLAAVAEVVSLVPVLPDDLWQLCRFVAARAAGSPADILRLAIPKRYVKVEKDWWARQQDPSAAGEIYSDAPELERHPANLVESLLAPHARNFLALPYGMTATDEEYPIPQSARAIAHLAATALSQSQSVIICVPDWRDIEHCHRALSDAIPADHLVLASGDQPPAQRYGNYLRTLESSPVVVLGNRHAVYSPASNIGLLIVVDDADSAHREPLAPYPHTRDVALARGSLEGIPVCFAGVSPSLAVARWMDMGYVLQAPVAQTPRARVIPSALSLAGDTNASPARLPSTVFQAMKEALERGPVLIQVFRAGYSPGLSCAQCKTRASCGHCGGPLRSEDGATRPACSWCGVAAKAWHCEECNGVVLQPRGQGIGRTISDLGKSFPSIPVLRSDGEHPLSDVPHAPALVIATRGSEPVTPGGFPLVLLLDGASMVQRSSLGALEESLEAWEHAISFAADEGIVYVTDLDGPPALALAAGSWNSVIRHELAQREALRLPPAVRIASLSGSSRDVEAMYENLKRVAPAVDSLGPVSTGDHTVTLIVRFSYSDGEAVTRELHAARHKLAMGPRRNQTERVKIVVDDTAALDALAGE